MNISTHKLLEKYPEDVRLRHEEFQKLKRSHVEITSQIYHFKENCTHVIDIVGYYGAVCVICDSDMGWYCEESPTKYCQYDSDEYCIHCGQDEERK